jgi:hypothetical protein
MTDPHVVTAMRAKRAELAGEIEIATRHLQGGRAALSTWTRRCACLTGSRADAIEPKVSRPKAYWAKRGEMTRMCLDIVRRAAGTWSLAS